MLRLDMLSALKKRFGSVPPEVWLMALTVGCLAPFIGKAFHIDDTLFLRVAEQIHKHPADFMGFQMNWFGEMLPMVDNFQNPPLASYYIAAVAWVAGWSEFALHAAFLIPAVAAAVGTFNLAKFHCNRPALAAVVAILTPVFLISATNIM